MNTADSNSAVSLCDLTIGYKAGHDVRTVAEGINATLQRGVLTCLLGENGVGKSTLLRTMSGFQKPLAGTVIVDGRRIEEYSPRSLARTIGVVLTEKPDAGLMTAKEMVAMGRSPYTGFWGRMTKTDRETVDMAIDMVGIAPLAHRQVATLSDGERQKVMIAKALAQQTGIIFLDEPTAFLDYPSKADMLQLLRRICHESDKAVFLSTHDLELTLQAADTLWLMTRNNGLLTGTPRELARTGALAAFVERGNGVTFDPQRLTVNVETDRI